MQVFWQKWIVLVLSKRQFLNFEDEPSSLPLFQRLRWKHKGKIIFIEVRCQITLLAHQKKISVIQIPVEILILSKNYPISSPFSVATLLFYLLVWSFFFLSVWQIEALSILPSRVLGIAPIQRQGKNVVFFKYLDMHGDVILRCWMNDIHTSTERVMDWK
jgi:hypothetical protein